MRTEIENPRHANKFLTVARSLREVVGKEAPQTEAGGTLSPAAVEALKDSGLFWMCVPVELGGGDAGIVDSIEVIEEVGCIDGSSGWSLMVNLSQTAIASAFLGDDAVDAMFGGKERAIVAGVLAPNGRCIEQEGGYFGGGNYGFGSGMGHATWMAAGMLVMADGAPHRLPNGAPELRACFIPKTNVEQKGNWNVIGLVGTGSFDFSVPEQFVPKSFTFEVTSLESQRGSPVFKLGVVPIACAGHAAIVLGLMKRAMIEIANVASLKKRPGYKGVIAERDAFKYEFAMKEAAYQAARFHTYETFRAAEEVALSGKPISQEMLSRIRQVTTWLHLEASDIVRFCHLWSGSEALRSHTILSRVSRDMAAASQHVFVDPVTLVDNAPPILEHWKAEKY